MGYYINCAGMDVFIPRKFFPKLAKAINKFNKDQNPTEPKVTLEPGQEQDDQIKNAFEHNVWSVTIDAKGLTGEGWNGDQKSGDWVDDWNKAIAPFTTHGNYLEITGEEDDDRSKIKFLCGQAVCFYGQLVVDYHDTGYFRIAQAR